MKKIFLTVGNDFHSFHRLVESADKIAKKGSFNFTTQYGCSDYIPKYIKEAYNFLNREQFYKIFESSDLIISHAGIGTTIDTIRYKKKMILIPRQAKFKEHFNDHQLEIAKEIENRYENILVLYDIKGIESTINELLSKNVNFPKIPDIKNLSLVKEIKEFILNIDP